MRAIFVSAGSGCCSHTAAFALVIEYAVGLVQAAAAARRFAKRRVAGFGIAGDMPCGLAEFAFADRVTDADVHSNTPAIGSQKLF